MNRSLPIPITWLDQQIGRLATALAVVGSLGIAALIVMIVVAVFWRYFLNNPIFGVTDWSTMVLTLVAGSSVAYGARNGSHVSVDVIASIAGPKIIRLTDVVMRMGTIGIAGLATYALFKGGCGIEKACITSDLSIEHRPFYYFLGLCLGVFTLQTCVDLFKGFWAAPPHKRTSGAQ